MKTLPLLCMEWGESVDLARQLLRRRPDLAGLGQKFGATRLFDAPAARKIRAAIAERTAAKVK